MAPNSWGQGREVGPLRLSISGGLRVVHGLPGVAVQRPGTGQNKSSITGEKPAVPDVGFAFQGARARGPHPPPTLYEPGARS